MSRRFLGMVGVGIILAGSFLALPQSAPAQAVAISVRSADALFDGASYLIKAVAPEEQAQAVLGVIEQFRNPEALKGFDRTRPIVALAWLPEKQGDQPEVVLALPITNLNQMLESLKGFGATVEENAGAPGFSHQVTAPGTPMPMNLVSTAKYAFFSLLPKGADKIKALKPETWVPNRPGAGEVAVSLHLDKVPQQYKDMFIAQMDQSLEQQRTQRPGETDPQYKGRLAGMDVSADAVKNFVKQGRDVTLELGISPKREEISLELSAGALPGTEMATTLQGFASRRSRFASLGQGAPLAYWASVPMADFVRSALTDGLEQARKEGEDKAESPAEKELVGKLIDALKPTLTGEEIDMGLAIQGPVAKAGGDPLFVLVGGVKVADGKKIEATIRDAVAAAKPEDKAQVKLDVAKAADGTAIHEIRGKEPADAQAAKAFGDPVMYVAIRNDDAYVTFGENGLDAIQKVLAAKAPAAAASQSPVELMAHVSKLAGLANDNREAVQDASSKAFASGSDPKDAVRLSLRGEGAAVRLRFAVQVPAVKFFALIGAATQGKAAADGAMPDAAPTPIEAPEDTPAPQP